MSKRKAPITQEAVNNTCNTLIEEGKTPSVNAVINKIGGSFSTVGNMVSTWKEEQAAQSAPTIEMPESVTTALHKAVADIWSTASSLAGETVERIQNEASEAVSKAKKELAEYADEVKRLEEDIETMDDQLDKSEQQIKERDSRITELMTENAALKTRIDDRTQEIERLRADYATLQAELITIAKQQAEKEKSK